MNNSFFIKNILFFDRLGPESVNEGNIDIVIPKTARSSVDAAIILKIHLQAIAMSDSLLIQFVRIQANALTVRD